MGIFDKLSGRPLRGALALVAATALFACTKKPPPDESAWAKAAAEQRANGTAKSLVLVTIDTLRADAVGAYGGEWKTPHLDAFAKQSVVYENAFVTAPFTGPSHASILTSRHPSKHGVIFNGHRVRGTASPQSAFVSEHLRSRGFATAAVISPSPTSKRYGFGRGFDHFDGRCKAAHGDVAADGACIIERSRQWLETRDPQTPFFLWVHLFDPHFPYVAPPEMYERQGLDPEAWVVKKKKTLREWSDARVRKAYLADVYEGDYYFGKLMQALADLGLFSSTVVAVTSDHGEYLGEHGLYDHHGLYDEVLHVPLMIGGPGLGPARRSELVSTIDLVPTVLAALRVPPMPSAQGRSVLAVADKDAEATPVFAEWRHYRMVTDKKNARAGDFQLGVRTPSDKLVLDWLFPTDASMLFDLRADPAETTNRIERDEAKAKALGDRLKRHVAEDLDPSHVERSDIEIDEQTMKMLEALGYVE